VSHPRITVLATFLIALACHSNPAEESIAAPSDREGMSGPLSGVWYRKEPDTRFPSVLDLTSVEQKGSRRVLATDRDGRTEITGSWSEVALPPPSLGSFQNPPWNECDARILLPGWPELEGTIEVVVEGEDFFLELRITDHQARVTTLYERRASD
jgi:hypothetical protein